MVEGAALPDVELISEWTGSVRQIAATQRGSTKRTFKVDCFDGNEFLCKETVWKQRDLSTRYGILTAVKSDCSMAIPLARDGRPFLTHGGVTYELFSWIQSDQDVSRQERLREAGASLGAFHSAVSGHSSFDRLRRELKMPLEPDAIEHDVREACHALAPAARPDAGTALTLLGALVAREKAALRELAVTLAAAPRQWIHGDYHLENVVIAPSRCAYLVDFDKFMCGWRIYDVAKFVMCECFDEDGRYSPAAAEAFAAGYGKHLNVSDDEVRVLPALVLASHGGAAWLVRQVGHDGDHHMAPLITLYCKRMRTLLQDFREIASAMTSSFRRWCVLS